MFSDSVWKLLTQGTGGRVVAQLILSAHEWALVQAIETGSTLVFQTEQGNQPEIRAQALIDIILGKDVAAPEEAATPEETESAEQIEALTNKRKSFPRPVAIRSAGIRFANAMISGELNLQDASGPGDSMLPRLKMVNCRFDKPIRLQRARLRSLSLKGSRFTMLDVSNAHIGGRVDLSGVRGLSEVDGAAYYGQCWVLMVSTRIEGLVTARYARFVAPEKRPQFVQLSWFANYALDLRAADISGSVILRPRCRALGGISLTLANIQGSVWASGAEVTAIEENAFSADYAVVRGSVYLRPYDPSKDDAKGERTKSVLDIDSKLELELGLPKLTQSEQFRATGSVSLFACKLGGSLYMDGAEVKKGPAWEARCADEEEMVDVRNAEIAGDCNFSAWQCETKPVDVYGFKSDIKVTLDAARIRNKLTFKGATVPSICAKNIEVGGQCNFCAAFYEEQPELMRFFSEGIVEITSAKIGGDLLFCGAKIGEEKPKTAATPACDHKKEPENIGLSLAGSTIGGSCFIETFAYIDHTTGEQRGQRFECYGVIRFSKAKITRSLRMDGARIEAKADSDRATLDLAGSFIGGDAYLRTWHEPGAAESYRFEAIGGRTVIRLSGTRIGQNLIMNGARLEAKPDFVAQVLDQARSVYALKAVNADIGGKAELSTFPGKSSGNDANLRFESTGLVSFAMATVSLGLNMEGSQLKEFSVPKAAAAPNSSAVAKSTVAGSENETARSLALDLSDARLKFVRLGRDRWTNCVNVKGDLNLDRTKTDAEVNLSYAVVKGELAASSVQVGAKLDLSNAEFYSAINLGGAEIDADLILCGTTVRDRLKADGIRVGNSILLEKTILPTRGIAQAMAQAIDGDKTLAEQIANEHLTMVGRIRLERRVHNIARLRHITRKLDADISFQNGQVAHALKVEALNVELSPDAVHVVKADENLRYCTIDLRGLHIGELGDSGGNGWTNKVRLWLDGFRYDRLPEVSGSAGYRAHARKKWLGLQYFNPRHLTKREYSPDAYEHLANGLKTIGAYRVAQKIVSERLGLEYRGNLLWNIFGFLFDYGYSIPRAIIVFVACICIGWGVVQWLDTHPYNPDRPQATSIDSDAKTARLKLIESPTNPSIKGVSEGGIHGDDPPIDSAKEAAPAYQTRLVLTMSTPEARYSYEKHQIFLVEPEEGTHEHADLVPCGDRVVPLLYAMDVFLPVLNLHQEENCSIRPEATGWRIAQAFYAVLGWIVTPLSILTFSGILRRHLEK
jgi:hypothetical protein